MCFTSVVSPAISVFILSSRYRRLALVLGLSEMILFDTLSLADKRLANFSLGSFIYVTGILFARVSLGFRL
ncbi:hypothetical protein D3C81_2144100 [compost metagenome]